MEKKLESFSISLNGDLFLVYCIYFLKKNVIGTHHFSICKKQLQFLRTIFQCERYVVLLDRAIQNGKLHFWV